MVAGASLGQSLHPSGCSYVAGIKANAAAGRQPAARAEADNSAE